MGGGKFGQRLEKEVGIFGGDEGWGLHVRDGICRYISSVCCLNLLRPLEFYYHFFPLL